MVVALTDWERSLHSCEKPSCSLPHEPGSVLLGFGLCCRMELSWELGPTPPSLMDPLLHHSGGAGEEGFTPGMGMKPVCAQPQEAQQPSGWTRGCSARARRLRWGAGAVRAEAQAAGSLPSSAAWAAAALSRLWSGTELHFPFPCSAGPAAPSNSDPSNWSFPGQCVTPFPSDKVMARVWTAAGFK